MVETICSWLPKLELYDSEKGWGNYEKHIYSIFSYDFKTSYPTFEGKKVNIRYHPMELNKEEGFYHVTCQDYNNDGDRVPDLRRCERIRWVRKFIENYQCNKETCTICSGVKVWDEPYKNTFRTHILLEEEKYMVVIEKRHNYCLLITAYYFDREHTLEKKLKKYEKYKAKSAS